MKPSLFVFCIIIIAQISVIKGKGTCRFKYSNGTRKTLENNCECGRGQDRKPFKDSDDKYCCLPSKSTCNVSETNKWCEDGQLLPLYQPCNGSCIWSSQVKCPQINGASFTNEQCYGKGWSDDDKYSVILI